MSDTITKVGVPPVFSERVLVRCTEHSFKPNKNKDPMLTTKWELCGYFDGKELKTEIKKGNTIYKLAGLSANGKFGGVYFTLNDQYAQYFKDFYKRATGEELATLDFENPPREFLSGLMMQAIAYGYEDVKRKTLMPDEIAALKEAGKEPIGEPLTDEDGNVFKVYGVTIGRDPGFLKRWEGELPAPY